MFSYDIVKIDNVTECCRLRSAVLESVLDVTKYDFTVLQCDPFNYANLMECSIEYLYENSVDEVKKILTNDIRIEALENELSFHKHKVDFITEKIKELKQEEGCL